ncbi:hypothetical protein ACHAPT_011721 [Fusarium lateritium]
MSVHTASTPSVRVISKRDADAMTGMVGDPSTSVEFFGSSSAASFMRQINTAIDVRLGRSQASADLNSAHPSKPGVSTSSETKVYIDPLAYTLPQRSFADSLLQDYYRLVWVILPVHDWTIFREAYKSVWLGSGSSIPEHVLYCMINLAFALGSQFSQAVPPSDRREMGQTFWKRAHMLFDPRLNEGASLEGVQCLLLMGLFLQSTCESHQCWMTVGSAIRMAQSLGLHLSSSARKNEGVREVEIARRVWHGCVFMDRVLSMTFGRPSMIADWLSDAVPLPLMIDDDFLDTQVKPAAVRPDGRTTEVAFFIKSLELYSIVNDSLLQLYMSPKEKSAKENDLLASVLRLDSQLTQWARSIPQQLSCAHTSTDEDFLFQRQRIVLRARYLHARILVLRPIVAEFYLKQAKPKDNQNHSRTDEAVSQRLVDECFVLCFEAAHETINIFQQNLDLDTVTGPVPAWWFALVVYTAATVLLAERFRPTDPSAPTSEPWHANTAWNQAIQLLRAYSRVGESAERCVAALEILSAKIKGQSRSEEEVDQVPPLDEIRPVVFQDGAEGFRDLGDSSVALDFEGMDFDVNDMLWLNSSAADILF